MSYVICEQQRRRSDSIRTPEMIAVIILKYKCGLTITEMSLKDVDRMATM